MGFTLKVTKGAGSGAEFPFDTKEARLGRTADNDIVVKDTGASRSHARVFEKGGAFFVEDLQSANGTKHNGVLISAPRQLKGGDTVTIGDVTFTFAINDSTLLKESTLDEDEPAKEDPNATLLKPAEEPEEKSAASRRNKRSDTEALGVEAQPPKREKGGRAAPAEREDNSTVEVQVPPPSALKKRDVDEGLQPSGGDTREVVVPAPRAGSLRRGSAASHDHEASVMTAAEKARRRRQLSQSTSGRLSLMWSELPRVARVGVGALGALLGLALVAAVVWVIVPRVGDGKKAGPEPVALAPNGAPIEESFGEGDDVTYDRRDMKIFTFNAQSPTRVVAVLHYQARDISKDEVTIAINGAELGTVPPDTMDTSGRGLETVFPPNLVKAGEENQLVFDNVRNPPADDPWRVWNIWVEILPIPDLTVEDTLRQVRSHVENAEKLYGLRDVGPENLFRAWKTYREAWLLLESMPEGQREGYDAVRRSMRELQPQLDKKCSTLLLDYQRVLQAKRKDFRKARTILEDIGRYFPTREHWCHGQSRALLQDLPG